MPFYEYECESCKFYTELLQKVSDAPLKKCPSCGKNTMKKLVSAPVFRLKGGGWYETDFKSENENKRNLAIEKEPDTAADSKPEKGGTTEAKADAKPSAESKPTEAKASGGGSVGAGARKAASSSRAPAASKSRAKKPAAKAKAKKRARR